MGILIPSTGFGLGILISSTRFGLGFLIAHTRLELKLGLVTLELGVKALEYSYNLKFYKHT
jgi:hypothetical protein